MYQQFPLFQNHLDLARDYWKKLLVPGDCVIDATCGNGHDTLALAQLVLSDLSGSVWGFDIQSQAISITYQLLSKNLTVDMLHRVNLIPSCHSTFSQAISPESVKLIVYNLGYLPGGNKNITTLSNTTLISLKNAVNLITPGGVICVTCYPGHAEGKVEAEGVLDFLSTLNPRDWSSCCHTWMNRKLSPILVILQKGVSAISSLSTW